MDTYPYPLNGYKIFQKDHPFKDSRIKLIKKKLRKFFGSDLWTCKDNPDFDPKYTQNELIGDIIDICRD